MEELVEWMDGRLMFRPDVISAAMRRLEVLCNDVRMLVRMLAVCKCLSTIEVRVDEALR